jgi:hypothetical protein
VDSMGFVAILDCLSLYATCFELLSH